MRDIVDIEKIKPADLVKGIEIETRNLDDAEVAQQRAEDQLVATSGALSKVGMGLFPTIKQLFRMGVKPGSQVSLMKYLREPTQKALRGTATGLHTPRALGRGVSTVRPVAMEAPPRLFPDVREILEQRARAAGTFSKLSAEEESPIPPHHFRNILFATGPVSGALSGGARPISDVLKSRLERAEGIPYKGMFKKLPWREAGRGALKGIVPGAIGGLLTGMLLDMYLRKKFFEKESADESYTPEFARRLLQNEYVESTFDPQQAQMLQEYYQPPPEPPKPPEPVPVQQPPSPPRQEQAQMLEQHYQQAQQAPPPPVAPEPQQLTADNLEQQIQAEVAQQPEEIDGRSDLIQLARIYEQHGYDPVDAMSSAAQYYQQLMMSYGDPRVIRQIIQTAFDMQQRRQGPSPEVAQQQDYYRQKAAPPPPPSPEAAE